MATIYGTPVPDTTWVLHTLFEASLVKLSKYSDVSTCFRAEIITSIFN